MLMMAEGTPSTFHNLPVDVAQDVFAYLAPAEIIRVQLTCKSLQHAALSNSVWREVVKRQFLWSRLVAASSNGVPTLPSEAEVHAVMAPHVESLARFHDGGNPSIPSPPYDTPEEVKDLLQRTLATPSSAVAPERAMLVLYRRCVRYCSIAEAVSNIACRIYNLTRRTFVFAIWSDVGRLFAFTAPGQYSLGCLRCIADCDRHTSLAHYHSSLQLNPNHVNTLCNIAAEYVYKKPAMAEVCYKRALSLDPFHFATLFNFAHMKYVYRQYNDAVEYYLAAVEVCSKDEAAWSRLRDAVSHISGHASITAIRKTIDVALECIVHLAAVTDAQQHLSVNAARVQFLWTDGRYEDLSSRTSSRSASPLDRLVGYQYEAPDSATMA